MIDRALRRLRAGQDPSLVLAQLASTLTNRILHRPSQQLRQAAELQQYDMLKAADWLFRGGDDADES